MTALPPSRLDTAEWRTPRRLWIATIGLGVTQMIGWGTTFTALGILGVPIGRDLGLPREAVFGGISVMLLVSAILARAIGRRIDRDGARSVMVPGTLVGALGLLVLALAQGLMTFALGWAIFGVAVAMTMNNAAVPALVDIAGPRSRQAVSAFTILTGITGAIFLPLTAWLEQRYGWRVTMLIFSVLFLVVCLPLHLAVLPDGRLTRGPPATSDPSISWDGDLPAARRRMGYGLVALWLALQGFIVWGFNIQVVDILAGAGLSPADAVFVWTFAGPAQALVRLADLVSGGRTAILSLAVMSAAALPLGFLVLWLGGLSIPVAIVLAIMAGAGQGLHAVARNLVPLRLFGLRTYGTTMGRLSVPLSICNAASPLIFATLIGRVGSGAALTITLAAAVLSLAVVIALRRLVMGQSGPDPT